MRVDLVERAQGGDEDAFGALVDEDGGRLFAIAYRILRDVERAEDAVQQTYLVAWRELPRLRDRERYGPWLHRLLVNACYEESRRWSRWRTRVHVLPIEGPAEPDHSQAVEDRDALERAFGALSPEHRAVFVLHHHIGMALAEIADIVGVPIGTVKSRLHYATRHLRAALSSGAAGAPAEAHTA
jgi:RNA polymerase sigma-70 factor (ECF subfamily)